MPGVSECLPPSVVNSAALSPAGSAHAFFRLGCHRDRDDVAEDQAGPRQHGEIAAGLVRRDCERDAIHFGLVRCARNRGRLHLRVANQQPHLAMAAYLSFRGGVEGAAGPTPFALTGEDAGARLRCLYFEN